MWTVLVRLFFTVNIFIFSLFLEAAPLKTTYQAKIFKPDGFPLESNNVSFRFTTLDPAASCVLYIEDFSAVNMSGSGGLISFSLGNGVRSYPASSTTFASVFDNSTISYSCQAPGIFSPVASDNRKIVMQFNDGTGWQTLPAMAINAVPYAMYASSADDSHLLNGKTDTAFVEKINVPVCASDRILYFNGASFSCIDYTGNGAGGGISSVTTSGSVLVNTGTASAPVLSVTVSSISTDGYLTSLDYQEFKNKLSASSSAITSTLGYAPVSSSAVATQITSALASQTLSGDVNGSFSATTVSQVGGKTASQVATSVDETLAATAAASASTLVKRDGSGGASFNSAYIYKPGTNFSVRLQAHASLAANYVLTLPQDDGNSGQVLSTDGSGNLSWINPSTGSVVSVSGTSNEITSTGGATPVLALADVGTAGTYFKVITDSKGRVVSGAQLVLSDVTTALGYVPAASGSITSSQWVTSGSTIYYTDGHVGVGTSAPTSTLHVEGGAQISYENSVATLVMRSGNTGALDPQIVFRTSHGTLTTPTSLLPGDSVGGIYGAPHNGAGYAHNAFLGFVTDTAFQGTAITFKTGSNGIRVERLRLSSSGNIGIGTATPVTQLDVSGGVRISMESATCTVSYAGTLRYNLGQVEYCNGSTWSAFGISGSGMQSFNGSTSGTQSFAIGAAGNSPAFNTSNGVHTLNIPLASAAGSVTAGLISNADYQSFNNKVSSQWTTSGSTVNYLSGNVGIGTNNPDAALSIVTATAANPGLKIYNSATGTGIGLDPYYPTVEFNRWHDGTNGRAFGSGYTGALNMDPANGDFRFLTGNNPGAGNIPTMADALIIKNSGRIGIGTTTPSKLLEVNGDAKINGLNVGMGSGSVATNTSVGASALYSNTTGARNTANGYSALLLNAGGNGNTAVGHQALYSNTGSANTAVGESAIYSNTVGIWNIALGGYALYSNVNGNGNIAIGVQAGYDITSGQKNIVIGFNGVNWGITTGSNNIIMGNDVRPPSRTADNQLNIGNLIYATGLGSGGILSTGNVGIGTSSPAASLEIHNNDEAGYMTALADVTTKSAFKIRPHSSNTTSFYFGQGNSGAAHIIQAANGPGTGAYDLSFNPFGGNVGIGTTNPTSNFEISGTTITNGQFRITTPQDVASSASLFMRFNDVNGSAAYLGFGGTANQFQIQNYKSGAITLATSNTERLRVDASGNVGIGTSAPAQLLHVAGNNSGNGNQTGAQIGDVGTGKGPLFLVHNNPTVAGNAYYNSGWKYGGGTGKPAWIDLVNGVKFFISNNTVGTAGTSITDTVSAKMIIASDGNVGIGTTTPQAKLEVNGDARFGCRAGFWPVADGRICMETTLRTHTSINGMATGTITDNAIATCKGVGPGSRLCTHTDFQQACGARAISGIPDVDPYGGVANGVYGDHTAIVSGQVTFNPSSMPAGHSDDVYLTWNGTACSANNDGLGRHANETSSFSYRCCY